MSVSAPTPCPRAAAAAAAATSAVLPGSRCTPTERARELSEIFSAQVRLEATLGLGLVKACKIISYAIAHRFASLRSDLHQLPTTLNAACCPLPPTRVAALLDGKHKDLFDRVIVLDCRYPFEYEGSGQSPAPVRPAACYFFWVPAYPQAVTFAAQ